MSANLAVLTRLSRIAGEPASDVARAAATCALVDAYTRGLYDRLGIVMTHRPTIRAKQDAKDELDAVRLMVFRAELGAADGVAHVFATARQRIEMARRALDLRIVDEERRREGTPAHLPRRATTAHSSTPCANGCATSAPSAQAGRRSGNRASCSPASARRPGVE
jgi:hypothetical protein